MAKSSVEQHPSRANIERELREGIPVAVVARGYDLSRSAVTRFKKRVVTRPAAQSPNQDDPDFIIGQFKSLYSIAAKAAARARDAGAGQAQITAQREARATLTLIGKLIDKQKAAQAKAGITSGDAPPPDAVYSALMRALEGYPEAKASVVAALTWLEQEWRPAEASDD